MINLNQRTFWAILLCLLVWLCPGVGEAQLIPTNTSAPGLTNWLNSWEFSDTNWLTQRSNAPVAYTTNLANSPYGDGNSLLVDDTNAAFIQYRVLETNGLTNLSVSQGTLTFWFNPDWVSVSKGGTGPGVWSRFIEVGSYTTNAAYGWWSIYSDPGGSNLYFSVQPGDGSSTLYLSAPISWTNRLWHFVALTYSTTNTELYLDGLLATNGAGLTGWPGTNVLTNGFWIGSDSNGLSQAQGAFDDVETWNVPWTAGSIAAIFNSFYPDYFLDPANLAYNLSSGPSGPQVTPTFQAVTGAGFLTPITTNTSNCVTSSNIWITNIMVTAASNGTMNVTFGIAGGTNGILYDVFANSVLAQTNIPWAWIGQGNHCVTYTVTNLPASSVFLILGTPQDTDQDGLTDAYERLVSRTDPNKADTSGDGMLDGWKILWGLNPLINNSAQSNLRANFIFDTAPRLKQLFGVRTETLGFDSEGNITQDSQ